MLRKYSKTLQNTDTRSVGDRRFRTSARNENTAEQFQGIRSINDAPERCRELARCPDCPKESKKYHRRISRTQTETDIG